MTDRTVAIGQYTSTDLHLIFHTVVIGAPEAKTNEVNIPGSDSVLDLTEIYGDIFYKKRKITMSFWIDPTVFTATVTPLTIYARVLRFWQGERYHIKFSSDQDHYYIGRISVGDLQRNGSFWGFNIVADAEPFRYDSDGDTSL